MDGWTRSGCDHPSHQRPPRTALGTGSGRLICVSRSSHGLGGSAHIAHIALSCPSPRAPCAHPQDMMLAVAVHLGATSLWKRIQCTLAAHSGTRGAWWQTPTPTATPTATPPTSPTPGRARARQHVNHRPRLCIKERQKVSTAETLWESCNHRARGRMSSTMFASPATQAPGVMII